MTDFTPQDPNYAQRVRASFGRQRFMSTIGAALTRVEPGAVEIEVGARGDLVQQHGFLHAGVLASAADSACGYAAFSLMPEGVAVLSVEFWQSRAFVPGRVITRVIVASVVGFSFVPFV